MAAKQVQIRRDTDANLMLATPVQGELGYNMSKERLHLGDGSTLGGMLTPNARDIQNSAFSFCVAGGTADAITTSFTQFPLIGAPSAGLRVSILITANNTGPANLNIDTQGADPIKKLQMGSIIDLEANDMVSGMVYDMIFDGLQWILMGFAPKVAQAWEFMEEQSLSGNAGSIAMTQNFDSLDTRYMMEGCLRLNSSGAQALAQVSLNGGSTWVGASYTQSGFRAGATPVLTSTGGIVLEELSDGTNDMLFFQVEINPRPDMNNGVYFRSTAYTRYRSAHSISSGWISAATRPNALRVIPTAQQLASGSYVRTWRMKPNV